MDRQALILVVDDEPFNIDVLEQELADLDYMTASASNGEEALERVGALSPDLVLLDVMMPLMDGFEVLSRLKASPGTRDIPVVVISALNDIGSVVKGIELGADDYLPKPFDPVLLQARIGACLEKKRYRDREVEYLRQVERLTTAAADVERNVYDPAGLELVAKRPDALGNLARVFQRMADQVHIWEQRLRQQLQQVTLDLEERQQARAETVANYLPMDRRQALAHGQTLPGQSTGAAMVVDVSGFTDLTERLAQRHGLQRGAEELIRQLNRVFGVLTEEVHRFRGSVVSFGGDAMTVWFDADDGQRATACAVSMQKMMAHRGSDDPMTEATKPFAVKVAVAAGSVRRLLVGDPDIQVIESLAGSVVQELTMAERLTESGEVVVQASIAETNGGHLTIADWRTDPASGMRFAVVSAVAADPVTPWPDLLPNELPNSECRPWLLPAVYQRVRDGKSEFLAE
ncbi:MAG: response regulator, partial [Chloroflexota bacterium]|nr:response regulator [Chloroflexota bacterium]